MAAILDLWCAWLEHPRRTFGGLYRWAICVTENTPQQMSLQCLYPINVVFTGKDKIFIKSLYLKWCTTNRLTDEFPEKNWTKHGVNMLLKKLRDTGTVDRRPGSTQQTAQWKENSYAFTCLIFQIFCSHINTLSIHSYTHKGIKLSTQMQFVCIFFHICWISAENLNF